MVRVRDKIKGWVKKVYEGLGSGLVLWLGLGIK